MQADFNKCIYNVKRLKCSHAIASFIKLIVKHIQKQFDDKCNRVKLSSKAQKFYSFFLAEQLADLFKKIPLLSPIQIFLFSSLATEVKNC
jgi:exonuclease V gamma subunit